MREKLQSLENIFMLLQLQLLTRIMVIIEEWMVRSRSISGGKNYMAIHLYYRMQSMVQSLLEQ